MQTNIESPSTATTNKRSKKPAKKTWTLDEIRTEGDSFNFRAFDILTSAAFSALCRNDNSRKGITSRTRLTAEEVAETIREFRERLEWEEEAMESFLENARAASDKILKMISQE